jgi:hypothetical protein
MIIAALWSLLAAVINAGAGLLVSLIGGPPSWWPTGGYSSFVQGASYLLYFFNMPTLIGIVAFSMSMELVFLTASWFRRGMSFMSGGGGAI